jgi:hypothetical protein
MNYPYPNFVLIIRTKFLGNVGKSDATLSADIFGSISIDLSTVNTSATLSASCQLINYECYRNVSQRWCDDVAATFSIDFLFSDYL